MSTSNIRYYSFQKTDQLFFDTNIWLTINNPFGNEVGEKTRVYTNAYREIITKGIKICIDVIVLSEFINRSARLRFELWKAEYPEREELNFKKYRATEDYKESIQAIESAVQTILMDCRPINTAFSSFNLTEIISDYGNGQYDFNDLIIGEVCKANNLVLVTDDGDFRGMPISILTYNRKLLS